MKPQNCRQNIRTLLATTFGLALGMAIMIQLMGPIKVTTNPNVVHSVRR